MEVVPTKAMGTGSKGTPTRECTKSGEAKFGDKEQPFHLPSNRFPHPGLGRMLRREGRGDTQILGHYFEFPEVNRGSATALSNYNFISGFCRFHPFPPQQPFQLLGFSIILMDISWI